MPSIWLSRPPSQTVGAAITQGCRAPQSAQFSSTEREWLVAFIRHVGCPFAENTVKELRHWALVHPHTKVYVVSHGDADITQKWLKHIGGLGRITWVSDPDRHLYAQWGLGFAPLWHFGGPASLMGVAALWFKGIRNRMATGTRWQRAGVFHVKSGVVVWCHVPESAQAFQLPPN